MSTRIGPAYVVHGELMTVGGQMTPDTAMAEMIRQQLQTIGIDADVKEAERGLAFTTRKGTGHLSISKCLNVRRDENTFAAPSAGERPFQECRAPHGALGAPGPLGGNRPGRAASRPAAQVPRDHQPKGYGFTASRPGAPIAKTSNRVPSNSRR